MITLYHGSNVAISKVGLSKGLKDKDFGQGFYLTDILSQAESMAQRRVRIVGTGIPTVTLFSFDESILCCGDLNVKIYCYMKKVFFVEKSYISYIFGANLLSIRGGSECRISVGLVQECRIRRIFGVNLTKLNYGNRQK